MSMQSSVSDMLTRIRNGLMAGKKEVKISKSKFNYNLANLMLKEGYILGVEEQDNIKFLNIRLKYFRSRPVIEMIKVISLPSRRIYVKSKSVPVVCRGLGVSVISTSRGLMTDREARFNKLGGEVICQIL